MDAYLGFLIRYRFNIDTNNSTIKHTKLGEFNNNVKVNVSSGTGKSSGNGIVNRLRKWKRRIVWRKDKIAGYKFFVKVEGDMDSLTLEVSGGDERIAFGTMAKGQKKYGSTSTRLKREDSQGITYQVQKGDTLPGLAVKFGITTEQIRRANHLWANDSLFLRDKLIIPTYPENGNVVDVQPSFSTNSLSSTEHSHDLNGSIKSNNSQSSSRGNIVSSSIISSPQEEPTSYTSPQTPSTSNSGTSKHWTHPLSDSFEFEDCLSSPSSVRLESDESITPNSKHCPSSAWSPINQTSYQSMHQPNYSNGHENESFVSSNGYSSPHSHSSPTSPTPGCSSRKYLVKDHSEKSVQDFLSRIDNAIASSKRQAKSIKKTKPWVTFESDSESEQRHSGTSLLTQGRQLRYSLRKLEKKQEELFQL